MKKYVLIAGVNGAGKSTLYQTLDSLKEMKRINLDETIRTIGDWRKIPDVVRAGKIVITQMKEYFENGISFNQETTLCGNSILRNIELAKSLGYEIELHYVGVNSVEIAKERIAYRVQQGGHDIPDKDVERRYLESFERLKLILPDCSFAVLYDNTIKFDRFAMYQKGKCIYLSKDVPEWFNHYIIG